MEMFELRGGRNSLASYFRRIQFSFSSRDDVGTGSDGEGQKGSNPQESTQNSPGFTSPFVLFSHTEFARLFPIDNITAICPGGHSSSDSDLTFDMCEPKFLCTPEHSMQKRIPRLRLAHSGAVWRSKIEIESLPPPTLKLTR
jgi:hypothetical protein